MPFIAPAIVAAIGFTGVAATVATAVVSVGLSAGLSYASSRWLQPSQNSVAPEAGTQLSLEMDTKASRKIQVGTSANAGSLIYWQFYGPSNTFIDYVIALSDWPSGNLLGLFIDGKRTTINPDTSVVGYENHMWVRYHNGDWDQSYDVGLVLNSAGTWTTNDVLAGVTYVVVKMKYDPAKFPGGIPKFLFEFEGAKFYDFRKDSTVGGSGTHRWNDLTTWETTSNPAVVHYNWRRGLFYNSQRLYGMSTPSSSLPVTDFATAANYCDNLVNKYIAGGTEKRYTINGLIDTAADNRAILYSIMSCYSAKESEIGGIYKPITGPRAIVATITEDDVVIDDELVYTPYKEGGELINAVFGSYSNPANGYTPLDLPPRISLTDEATDGRRYERTLSFPFVTSPTQAQRLMEIARRQYRKQQLLQLSLTPKFLMLELGDWVTVTIDSEGIVNKTFEVVDAAHINEPKMPIVLQEVDSSIYSFASNDELTSGSITRSVTYNPPVGNDLLQGLEVSNVLVPAGDVSRPGISITWYTINDPTIVQIALEYRVVNSSTALPLTITDVSNNAYTWVNGIQSGVVYEVRIKPITLPVRSTQWTAWVSASSASAPQIVPVAISSSVANLSAQDSLELEMALTNDIIAGAVQERIHVLEEALQGLALAQMQLRSRTNGTTARVRLEETVRQSLSESFASYAAITDAILFDPVTGLPATTAAQLLLSSRISAAENSIDAVEARAFLGVSVDSNIGFITGGIDVYANALFSSIGLLANKTYIAKPDGSGAKQLITVGTVDGVGDQAVFNVDIVVPDNGIKARHIDVVELSAVSADLGTVTAGVLRDAANTYNVILEDGLFTSTDGKAFLNLKLKRLKFTP
jgi:Putative phage tail protein